MKYIDADKLRSVLQNTINSMKEKDVKGERYDAFLNGKLSICEELLGCIDSLQQEQPSLPSNIDEAAEKFTRREYSSPCAFGRENIEEWVSRIFKAGAECMAGQGVSMLGRIGIYGVDVESITKELREAGFNLGEEIILQIRKK